MTHREVTSETTSTICTSLQRLGVRSGGVLMVHASLRSLGNVPGGTETVVQGLLRAIGPDGTLLMPALSYMTVSPRQPRFDARQTPSCVGALPESFRTRPGTLRSTHPTHSVSGVGRHACELLSDHHLDHTPCGPHSPFHKLCEVNGQVLFIGCGLRPNTSMHAIEELIEPPYLYGEMSWYDCVMADGFEIRMHVRNHGFAGYAQRYDRLAALLSSNELQTGHVLEAECHLVECRPMWQQAQAKLQSDPLFFVDPDASSETR